MYCCFKIFTITTGAKIISIILALITAVTIIDECNPATPHNITMRIVMIALSVSQLGSAALVFVACLKKKAVLLMPSVVHSRTVHFLNIKMGRGRHFRKYKICSLNLQNILPFQILVIIGLGVKLDASFLALLYPNSMKEIIVATPMSTMQNVVALIFYTWIFIIFINCFQFLKESQCVRETESLFA
ncbi:hypothetical protein PMAYCL1PPCAC_05129 [Pristionchus mayeri]|uniref:Uncharacterized protein n=1 Tax=Pristionchus mayeri TaxID=1317129 RepID=A0AAN4Z879_9BILA|nr:hypothetical protein PMAYCL1PPCAC_05129 [Pristionchus mayeri]